MSPKKRVRDALPTGGATRTAGPPPDIDASSHSLLQRAVEEAARLLKVDGAMAYLAIGDGRTLHFAALAGVKRPEISELMRDLTLPVGVGLFGLAVDRCEPVVTPDYRKDNRFQHSEVADRVVRLANMRSMVVAPLIADGESLGALGAYSSKIDAFADAHVGLLQALADHAAVAISNRRLIERIERAKAELAERVDEQRTLGQISARITVIREGDDVLQAVVDAARRLLRSDDAHLTLLDDAAGVLRPTVISGGAEPSREWLTRLEFPLDAGINGIAAARGEPTWTEDYLVDARIPLEPTDVVVAERMRLRGMAAAPLRAPQGMTIGTLAVSFESPHAFSADELELLQGLADQGAIAISNARLTDELRASEERYRLQAAELQRRVEAQRALADIATRIAAIRDSSEVLQSTLDEAVRLLDADGGRIELVDEEGGLRWAFGHSAIDLPIENERDPGGRPARGRTAGVGPTAVRERRVVVTDDYLTDASFDHDEAADRYIRQHGVRSVVAAPVIGESGAIGAISVHSQARQAFDEKDAELLQALAAHAAIAVTNARLYEELGERVDAQRSLAEISAQIAALHDPSSVIGRLVTDAVRLLNADRAQVNLLHEGGDYLDRPVAAAPDGPSPKDVIVSLGSGVAGTAAAERRVLRTGDYLSDDSFAHDPGDALVAEQGIRSMMSAPLTGPDRLIGTITVQSGRPAAFSEDDAQLLRLLADQAAIAITNTRLLDRLTESEARYRFLVDNSPDIVWSVDADGRFTFLSDSLEARTGWRPEQLIGQPFAVLTQEGTRSLAEEAWQRLRGSPTEEQRVRLDLPLANGSVAKAEVAMTGTVIDGRFAGAHGSVRDISERERLEGDLRRHAAELAAGEERAHLARELHDSVTQALFSMGLTLRSLELLLEEDPDAVGEKLDELRDLQKDALAEMRALIFELRPGSLETDGLVQALRSHAAAVRGRTGLDVNVDAEPIDRLPLQVEEALYRIGQEALHNVVKHANADRAEIRLARDGESLRMWVIDDGAGFDPEDVPRGHLGLVGMRQRADIVGAAVEVSSRRGEGTRVEVTVPLTDRADAGEPAPVAAAGAAPSAE